MDSFTCFLLCLTPLSSMFVLSAPTAGPNVSITATEGQDTVLPCDGTKDEEITFLEWTLQDQKKTLLMFRQRKVLKGFEDPDYTDRVVLLDSQLNKGELSLGLRNVTLKDTGTYECRAVYEDEQGRKEISQVIHLMVKPKELSNGVVTGLLVGLTVGLTLLGIIITVIVVCYKDKWLKSSSNMDSTQASDNSSAELIHSSAGSSSHKPLSQDPLPTVTDSLLPPSASSSTLSQSSSDSALSDYDSENPSPAQVSCPDTANQSQDQSRDV